MLNDSHITISLTERSIPKETPHIIPLCPQSHASVIPMDIKIYTFTKSIIREYFLDSVEMAFRTFLKANLNIAIHRNKKAINPTIPVSTNTAK